MIKINIKDVYENTEKSNLEEYIEYKVQIKNISNEDTKDINFSSLYMFNTFLIEFSISLYDEVYMKILEELYNKKLVLLEFNSEDFNYIKERTNKTKYIEVE